MMAEDKGIRINKFLSEAGVCSRREADRIIDEGRVSVDGKTAEKGVAILPGQSVMLDGREIVRKGKDILLMFNKPPGIVCTAEKREKNNIIDYIGYPERIFPVGRLDKDSRGLILLTNMGELSNDILKAANHHEKEYVVEVNHRITDDFIERMSRGVYLSELDTTTRPCEVEKLSERTFRIILTQGLNRQIRRMCEALSYKVTDLKRVRILNLKLDTEEGKYREVSAKELAVLKKCLIRKK